MPIVGDWSVIRGNDLQITFGLKPPTNIGGMQIGFFLYKRLGSDSPLVSKYAMSGFISSGVSVVNSGQGSLGITLNSQDTSGLEPGNYVFKVKRLDSGFIGDFSEGTVSILW